VTEQIQWRGLIAARTLAAALALALAAPAWAGLFSVTPVRIFMAARDRATAVTVTNEGDTELLMQADIFDWKQKADGTDDLTLSEDMILAPPIIKLAPKSRQVLRLALTRPPAAGQQLTYRLIVREIPEARPPEKDVQVQIALAFSLPVFITPAGAKRQVECKMERTGPSQVMAVCENLGTAYAQTVDYVLTNAAGEKLATRETGGYILPGSKRSFEMTRPAGRIPGGPAKLSVAQDDASKQTFDVVVPD
jgi:fimbrial chaperone protein